VVWLDRLSCKSLHKSKIVVWEHACRVFLLSVNIFYADMLLEVLCECFFLLLCVLFLFGTYVWPRLWCMKENAKNSCLGTCERCAFVDSQYIVLACCWLRCRGCVALVIAFVCAVFVRQLCMFADHVCGA